MFNYGARLKLQSPATVTTCDALTEPEKAQEITIKKISLALSSVGLSVVESGAHQIRFLLDNVLLSFYGGKYPGGEFSK